MAGQILFMSRIGGEFHASMVTVCFGSSRFLLSCTVALLVPSPSCVAQGLASSDLSGLRSVGSVELSPDGRHIAYTVTMRDRPGRPYGQLWIMDATTQKSVRVGAKKIRRRSTVVAGRQMVRISGASGRKGGLFAARSDGSEVTFLTSLNGTNSPLPGAGKEFTWSPDGKQLAFISSTPGAKTAEASGDPMVITRYLYKPDAGEE